MLEVHAVSAGYGQAQVLHEVSFDVGEGQIVSVVGANGAGKTTLVKVISGLVRPTSGHIRFQDRDITRSRPDEIVIQGIVHVPEGRRLFAEMTVLENLLLGSTHPSARARRGDSFDHVFELFPVLKERRLQVAGTLSGGEQQMLAIGRGLMSRPQLLILDEPSLGLAPRIVAEILEVISGLNESGMTVLLIEQNVKHSLSIADWGLVLENGRIVLADAGEALLQNDHTRRAYLGI